MQRTSQAPRDTLLRWLLALPLLALALIPSLSLAQNTRISAEEFDRKAFAALPPEPSYAFHQELNEGVDPELGRRDPTAKPRSDEMALPNQSGPW